MCFGCVRNRIISKKWNKEEKVYDEMYNKLSNSLINIDEINIQTTLSGNPIGPLKELYNSENIKYRKDVYTGEHGLLNEDQEELAKLYCDIRMCITCLLLGYNEGKDELALEVMKKINSEFSENEYKESKINPYVYFYSVSKEIDKYSQYLSPEALVYVIIYEIICHFQESELGSYEEFLARPFVDYFLRVVEKNSDNEYWIEMIHEKIESRRSLKKD